MKKLKLIAVSFVLASQAACGGGSGDVDEIRKLKEDACACKDKACAQAIDAKLNTKLETMKQPAKSDEDTIAQLMVGAGLCISKFSQ